MLGMQNLCNPALCQLKLRAEARNESDKSVHMPLLPYSEPEVKLVDESELDNVTNYMS